MRFLCRTDATSKSALGWSEDQPGDGEDRYGLLVWARSFSPQSSARADPCRVLVPRAACRKGLLRGQALTCCQCSGIGHVAGYLPSDLVPASLVEKRSLESGRVVTQRLVKKGTYRFAWEFRLQRSTRVQAGERRCVAGGRLRPAHLVAGLTALPSNNGNGRRDAALLVGLEVGTAPAIRDYDDKIREARHDDSMRLAAGLLGPQPKRRRNLLPRDAFLFGP
eukprot:scaffold114_cov361-Pinguiococcus_pyrenoidosus.AAC.27